MITYASYAPKAMTIKSSALSIVVMNIMISVMAGLAIFPALHTFGYHPQEGPGLLFKVLPLVFSKMHFGIAFYSYIPSFCFYLQHLRHLYRY